MSRFITGSELNSEIEKLIRKANSQLIFISPFIKLPDKLKDELKSKSNKDKENLKIIIVFGKNEDEISKSLSLEDFEFFKTFPNLELRYEKRLHAKYYANDSSSILTSMNLYDYSFDKNIEFGVLSEQNLIGTNKLDAESIKYFKKVIANSEIVYIQEAIFETSFGGFQKTFKDVNVIEDNIEKYFSRNTSTKPRKLTKYTKSTEYTKPSNYPESRNSKIHNSDMGYCIRTGVKMEFNPDKPMSEKAYASWKRFENQDYPEKYCHFTGEPSNGENTFKRPILKKNWKEAFKYIKNNNHRSARNI